MTEALSTTAWRFAAIVVAVIAILAAQALPSGGLQSLSFDSFRYLAGAQSILETGTYRDLSGAPQRVWPPGTSLLYAVISHVSSMQPDQLVRIINLVALLLTALSLWLIFEFSIERRVIAIVAFTAFMLNTAFLSMLTKLWSDPLALATNIAAFACAIIAIHSAPKNWYGWLCGACVLLSIAINFRLAMIAGIPILAFLAIWLSRTTASYRHAGVLPLLTPLPMVIAFHILGLSGASARVSGLRPLEIQQNWQAFGDIADQLLPVRALPTGIVQTITLGLVIALPLLVATLNRTSPTRPAILICTSFIVIYLCFIVFAQSVADPSFITDIRILFQILPFMIITMAITIDTLWTSQLAPSRTLALIIFAVLVIGATRSVRAMSALAFDQRSDGGQTCVSRDRLLHAMTGVKITPAPPALLSNIQGLAWYIWRVPSNNLTWRGLADAPQGSVVIYVTTKNACPGTLEFAEMTEEALSNSPQVTTLLTNDFAIIARKK